VKILKKLISISQNPFPFEQSVKKRLLIIVLFGVFVSFFLLYFQPFNIYKHNYPYKTLIIGGYGFVTMVVMFVVYFIFPIVLPSYFNEKNWTIIKELLSILITIILITIANIIYFLIFNDKMTEIINLKIIVLTFISTIIIGFFPSLVMGLIYYNIQTAKYLKKSSELNHQLQITLQNNELRTKDDKIITFNSQNKSKIQVMPEDLLCIEANDNYVEFYYKTNQGIKHELIRNTMKNVEEQLIDHQQFIRCHKSYIINKQKLIKISGNSQGYKMHIEGLEFQIPVSRNISKTILEEMTD